MPQATEAAPMIRISASAVPSPNARHAELAVRSRVTRRPSSSCVTCVLRRCGLRCPCQRERADAGKATAACALLDDAGVSRSEGPRVRIVVVHNRYQVRGGEDVAVDDEI